MASHLKLGLIFSLGLSLGGGSVNASGTYLPAPPRLRSDITAEIDPAAYNQGKLIFAGKATLAGSAVRPEQLRKNREVLEDVAIRIPQLARDQIAVATLAGKLSQSKNEAPSTTFDSGLGSRR